MTEEKLTKEEGEDLLKLVRYALMVSQRKLTFFPKIRSTPTLREHRGVFVGFWKGKELRGCIGSVNPGKSLEESVVELSLKSALKDQRFEPIREEEIPSLELEITVLTQPILLVPSDIQLGVHGLMITDGYRAGLLLPTVPVESGWDVQVFLEQTCLKGGMSKDAWRLGASIGAFTVQRFRGRAETAVD